ncbi:hypothetical protein P9898_20690, partial [Serratia nevei]|uniref:hypothetical protein n=1 Tax=Serratia nevei TaxID=2703794 RepID=UPI00254AC9E4
RHRSVRLVILVGLAIDQIAQSGLSSLSVIYYSAQLFSEKKRKPALAGFLLENKRLVLMDAILSSGNSLMNAEINNIQPR